jgi:hypothetical protein
MEYLTAEQIADLTNDKDGLANIRAINKLFRQQDDSHLWPINGKFNATNRAIAKSSRIAKYNGCVYGLEYAYQLDHFISQIVNNAQL